jgi:hypothetical protein
MRALVHRVEREMEVHLFAKLARVRARAKERVNAMADRGEERHAEPR